MSISKEQIKAIHAGARAARLDEDMRRDLMQRLTGKRSSSDLTGAEAGRVIEELKRLGGNQAPGRSRAQTMSGPYAAKLGALWLAGWNLGVVVERDDTALIAFVERQTGIAHPRWLLEPEDAAKAIEGIKAWLEREAGWAAQTARELRVQALAWKQAGIAEPNLLVIQKVGLLRAQQRILAGVVSWSPEAERDLIAFASRRLAGASRHIVAWTDGRITPAALDAVSAALGREIRAAKARAA